MNYLVPHTSTVARCFAKAGGLSVIRQVREHRHEEVKGFIKLALHKRGPKSDAHEGEELLAVSLMVSFSAHHPASPASMQHILEISLPGVSAAPGDVAVRCMAGQESVAGH